MEPTTAEILLLDDDPFMLKLLTHMLAQLGYRRVAACDSGQAALQRVRGSPSGLALIRELKPNVGRDKSSPVPHHLYSVEQLRAAMAHGELVNYYQPKVAVSTREVVGVESLVRWQHPVDGLIFPDQFIELAAAHGLITEVTRLVLTGAAKQAKAWWQAGYHLPVAVNVSMDDLADLDFPDRAEALASSVGIEPRLITLEVTEGQVMRQLSTVLDVLSR